MPSPIASNDVLREAMPRTDATHTSPDPARSARGTDFADLLKQAFSPPVDGPSPSADQPLLTGVSLSRETIAAIDGEHASTPLPQRDLSECATDEQTVATSPEGSASPQSPVVAPAPQAHLPTQTEYTPPPELSLAGIIETGPAKAVPAAPRTSPANIIIPNPAGPDAASGAPSPASFANLLDPRPQPSTLEPTRDDTPIPELPAATAPSPSRPAPLSASVANERPPVPAGPDARAASPALVAPASSPTAPAPIPTSTATPTPAPSTDRTNPILSVDSTSVGYAPVSVVAQPNPPNVQSSTIAPVAAAASIIAADAAEPAVASEGTSITSAPEERHETPRESGTRSTCHPAATFTAQLAQQPDDPAARPAASPLGVPDAQQRAATSAPSVDNSTVLAEDPVVAGTSSAPNGLNDASAPRINASTGLDQVAARTMRVTAHPAIAQVAVVVTKAAQEGVDRITIKLQPPELGRIDVRLDVSVDGRIQAVFAAERSSTVDILQRDVRELERALQNAGLSADPGSLSFGLRQQNSHGIPRSGALPTAGEVGLTDGETAAAAFAAAAARAVADGRLDIHV